MGHPSSFHQYEDELMDMTMRLDDPLQDKMLQEAAVPHMKLKLMAIQVTVRTKAAVHAHAQDKNWILN